MSEQSLAHTYCTSLPSISETISTPNSTGHRSPDRDAPVLYTPNRQHKISISQQFKEKAKHLAVSVKREKWRRPFDFLLSCLGFAVGFGNVWRFPYMAGRNGGAAFLIPYLIFLVIAALPAFYTEIYVGQFSGLTPHLIFSRMCPIFGGIGYTMTCISFIIVIYYIVIMAYALRYFFASFATELPWGNCRNSWNSYRCYDDRMAKECTDKLMLYLNNTCVAITEMTKEQNVSVQNVTTRTPAEEYWELEVTGLSRSIEEMGTPKVDLVFCLLIAWVLIFFSLIKGVESSGKVVYFTATFPYIILTVLLIRGCTLPGAIDGIKFYMVPDVNKLTSASVWGDAATQVFFSIGISIGGLVTLASFRNIDSNLSKETFMVLIGDTLTSIYAGFVIFSILGHVSHQTGRPVHEIAKLGPGLAFIAYPDALARIPLPSLWAILFFFMFICLGIDSGLVLVKVITTAVTDQWVHLRNYPILVTGSLCSVCFLIGLILVCPGGQFVFNLMDSFAGGWALVFTCFFEMSMIAYFYGYKRFAHDIECMLGRKSLLIHYKIRNKVPLFWVTFVTSPILILFVLIFNVYNHSSDQRLPYGPNYEYPEYGKFIAWSFAVISIIWIPIVAIQQVIMVIIEKRSFISLIQPTHEWQKPT